MVNVSRLTWLAANIPSRSYFLNIFKLILLQIERHLSYEMDNPREKKHWITVFVRRDAYNFKPAGAGVSLPLTCLCNEVTDDEWPVIFLYWYISSCAMIFDDWLKLFICTSYPLISKDHNTWSYIGTEAFWQSGGKELLKVLLTLDMACLIGDISPTSDVTKVDGFCKLITNYLIYIFRKAKWNWFTNCTNLYTIVAVKEWLLLNFQSLQTM